MGSIVSSFFQLVLGVSSKLTLDAINKGLGVSEVLLEEGLELWLHDWSGTFVAALILGLSKADNTMKEGGGKQGTIYLDGA